MSFFNESIFFFFSSRRRHTRYWRDWSSDVCSSDLGPDQDKHRVQGHGCQRTERLVAPAHSQEENGRQNHIEGDVLQWIIHRIILLSEYVTGHHADRKSVVEGKSVDLGGRRIIKKKKQ